MAFVDLHRRFRDLSKQELEDPEFLASLNDREFGSPTGWTELLKQTRVLVLAEAGSGKTTEMQEQAARLTRDGKFAFFVALESIDREKLDDLLSAKDEKRLVAWRQSETAPAWFFLDAVDELKLTEGKLDRALQRFAKSIDGHLQRARVLISCRPNDWRYDVDMATFNACLPIPDEPSKAEPAPDQFFLDVLKRETASSKKESDDDQQPVTGNTVRTVILLPMSARQIEQFVQSTGVNDAAAFLGEIERQDAWTFARRPLDLAELVVTWRNSGCLGTRQQQHEANVAAKLRDDPNRRDQAYLTEEQAREGAERLALGLMLTRTRTIRSPEQTLDMERQTGVLDPAEVLRDWSEQQRQALLRRALFDPATYGRVRFHHRSVQEYLAARRLKTLREKGMPTKAVFRLLFANRYGVDVVLPSMRPIAAWLALWDRAVRHELVRREPEALLSMGDPESLDLGSRASLLRQFGHIYGSGNRRGLEIPVGELRRLAHAELAPAIRELWGNGPQNPDVRELLIETIWQGAIDACADLAESAAFNPEWNDYHRIAAVRALQAMGHKAGVRKVADAMVADSASWSDAIVRGLVADLFPDVINVDELLRLVERTPEPESSMSGIGWPLRSIVQGIDPLSVTATAVRDGLAKLIWEARAAKQEFYRVTGRLDHLAPALASLVARQIAAERPAHTDLLARAAVISSRFGHDDTLQRAAIAELKKSFKHDAKLREAGFWAEVAVMDAVVPTSDDRERLYHALHDGLIGPIVAEDRPWLEAALEDGRMSSRRSIALQALMDLWVWSGRGESELERLRSAVADDASLTTALAERALPPKNVPALEETQRDHGRLARARDAREAKRLENWKAWRAEVVADPVAGFSPARCAVTIENLYTWMAACAESSSRYNVWNKASLARGFGDEVAQRAAAAMQRMWRDNAPTLWSARAPEERNSLLYLWIYGLCGLSSEATFEGWAATLTPQEVRNATAYATIELNGLAPFLTSLARTHPREVEEIIGGELDAQLEMGGDFAHLPLLHDLTRASHDLKELLAPRLIERLRHIPETTDCERSGRWAIHADQLLRILSGTVPLDRHSSIAAECARRFRLDPSGAMATSWLRGLFRFDSVLGTTVLAQSLSDSETIEAGERAVRLFAALFGDRDGVICEIGNQADRAHALGQLVRLAYTFVRREEDQRHNGVYSPDTRDHAQQAREFLLSALLATPGPEARNILLELATETQFVDLSDRLRLLARRRAATDAEFPPFESSAIAELDKRYELPPSDRDGLFQAVLDRLDDLAHDLAHDDFTDRRTLGRISDETEMQRTLSWRLDPRANGVFVITREDEVADLKRTDIRFAAIRGDQKSVAEVKIADRRWTLGQLVSALRKQLVGQYLRHNQCTAGCLLLTYNGQKKYWIHPVSRKRLSFWKMVDYLRELASALEAESNHRIRVEIVGLDLTDPRDRDGANTG